MDRSTADSGWILHGGFVLALAILGAIGARSYFSLHGLVNADARAQHSREVLDALKDLTLEVTDVESAARGFALAGRDIYLEPYSRAVEDVDKTMGRLRTLTAGDERLKRKLAALEAPVAEKLEYHRRMIELRRAGSFEASASAFLGGRGQQLMDQIRRTTQSMTAQETALVTTWTEEAEHHSRVSRQAIVVGTGVGFFILIVIYARLLRAIHARHATVRRLNHLNGLYMTLSRVGQAVGRIRDRQTLWEEVCRIVVAEGGMRMAWIGLLDEAKNRITPAAFRGHEDGYLAAVGTLLGDATHSRGPTAAAIRTGRHFVSSDIAEDSRMLPWREEALRRGYRSSAAFPITVSGRVVGAFSVYAPDPGFFEGEIVGLLQEVAADLGFATENLEREAQRVAAERGLRESERRYRDLTQELESRVVLRTTELGEVNRKLVERNAEVEKASRMKNDFLARISHEFRTPLNAIVGYSDLLREESAGPLGEAYRRYVRNIQDGAQHLTELVNDLLDLSRIEAGRIELNLERCNVATALNEVLAVIAPLAGMKSIALESRVPPEIDVIADRVRFKQILYNLLSNAVKFTPEDGRVWIDSAGDDELLTICVGDTGIGIAPAEQEAIFEEFHQVAPAGAVPAAGAGLGLAITRKLVQLHGGSVRVESEPGNGSRFFVTLPGAAKPAPAAGVEAHA